MASRPFVVIASYRPNRPGIVGVALGDELKSATKFLAYKAKKHAESISPYDQRRFYTRQSMGRHYRGAFEVQEYIEEEVGAPYPWPRIGHRLANVSRQAIIVEVGALKTPAYRVMRRTLEFLENTGAD